MNLREWEFATLSYDRYDMAQGFLGRSCFKSFNIIKKLPLLLPHLKKILKFRKFFFVYHDIFFKKTSIFHPKMGKVCNLLLVFFNQIFCIFTFPTHI